MVGSIAAGATSPGTVPSNRVAVARMRVAAAWPLPRGVRLIVSLLAPVFAALPLDAPALGAQGVTNASFDEAPLLGTAVGGPGWVTRAPGYMLSLDTLHRVDGRASLRSERTDTAIAPFLVRGRPHPAAEVVQTLSPGQARGRGLRVTAWIRTERVAHGQAGLRVRVLAGERQRFLFELRQQAPRGTTPWARYAVDVPVDSDAAGIADELAHEGSGTAWFDQVAVTAIDAPPPVRLDPVFVPPARPPEDATRLLPDSALLPAPEPEPPAVDAAAAAWVRAHAHPIRSLDAPAFADLAFLRPLLAGKRLVQLGESSHGVREFNQVRVRLIRYLHEQLGYDVLAFESSLFACEQTGRRAASLTAVELMQGCLFGIWHTEELVALMEYVRATQRTARPLVLTGFDVAKSTRTVDRARPAFLQRVVAAVDSAYAQDVYVTDSTFYELTRTGLAILSEAERDHYGRFYAALAAWLRPREARLAAAFREDPGLPGLARQVAVSLSYVVQQGAATAVAEQIRHRDRGMAENLQYLLRERYAGRKVITWAHNAHVQHGGFAPGGTPNRTPYRPRTLGTYVAERYANEAYTIGLFMYQGSAANNFGRAYPVLPAAAGSLEAILHRAPWRYAFVDLTRARPEPGSGWIRSTVAARNGGEVYGYIVPRDEYDGLLLIDTSSPPRYVR